ncbi:hypothetical protein CEXT_806531 [Caerostris extrusa]|uniref:Uncharacterized protein n=1 Tax=Caerostris extrusa TaxID=172846 RepID=A0AAV4UC81_CAEEX|nr:hypothetical protein CEXT_806531 [Caerostris extrusa]
MCCLLRISKSHPPPPFPPACTFPLEHKELCRLRRNDGPGMSVGLYKYPDKCCEMEGKVNILFHECFMQLCWRDDALLMSTGIVRFNNAEDAFWEFALQSGIVFAVRLCWKVKWNYVVIAVNYTLYVKRMSILRNEFSLNLAV